MYLVTDIVCLVKKVCVRVHWCVYWPIYITCNLYVNVYSRLHGTHHW